MKKMGTIEAQMKTIKESLSKLKATGSAGATEAGADSAGATGEGATTGSAGAGAGSAGATGVTVGVGTGVCISVSFAFFLSGSRTSAMNLKKDLPINFII